MASTPLEHTSKTGSDQAYFVVLAVSACHAFFWGHQTHLLLWAYAGAKVSSFYSPENSQPVKCITATEGHDRLTRHHRHSHGALGRETHPSSVHHDLATLSVVRMGG